MFEVDGTALVATADFITPLCDDAYRFGRIAAANALSDVYAMGGRPLFALNLCCFPDGVPDAVYAELLQGGAAALREAGAALLGGHTVKDRELKYGLAVIGQADPERMLTNAGARPGDRLLLTKPVGTGVLINAYKGGKLDAAGLEPALAQMESLNAVAAELAVEHGAHAATDITGFGLGGHALAVARASNVGIELVHAAIPGYEAFGELVSRGVSTGSTKANLANIQQVFEDRAGLDAAGLELLVDPQTSGGLLIAVPEEGSGALLAALLRAGLPAAEIGSVLPGPPRLVAL